jgi:hypothetical protein
MNSWWQKRKKGEIPCAIGLLFLLIAAFCCAHTVYPGDTTVKAVLAGKHAPLVCLSYADRLIGLFLAISAFILFLRAGLKGESENRYIGFIGVALSVPAVLSLGFTVVDASIAYARWRGWLN